MNVLELSTNPSLSRSAPIGDASTASADDGASSVEHFKSHLSREQDKQSSEQSMQASASDRAAQQQTSQTGKPTEAVRHNTAANQTPSAEVAEVIVRQSASSERHALSLTAALDSDFTLAPASQPDVTEHAEAPVFILDAFTTPEPLAEVPQHTEIAYPIPGVPELPNAPQPLVKTRVGDLQPQRMAASLAALNPTAEQGDTELTTVSSQYRAQVSSVAVGTQISTNTPQGNATETPVAEFATLSFDELLDTESAEHKHISQIRSEFQSTGAMLKTEAALSPSANSRFSVNVQFGRAEWMADVAAQVAKVAAQNLNFAEIQLDPPELGALQVRVQLNNEHAAVSFSAQSAQVREALEQNGNRLRELFDAQGMNLVDVDVRDQSQQNARDELESEAAAQDGTSDDSASREDEGLLADTSVIQTEIQVGVDDYV